MNGAEPEKSDEVGQEEPRRSREEILREFKLALAIGDGSLLESDQERARGVNPYDSHLGGRNRGNGSSNGRGLGGHTPPSGQGSQDDQTDRLGGAGKARRRR